LFLASSVQVFWLPDHPPVCTFQGIPRGTNAYTRTGYSSGDCSCFNRIPSSPEGTGRVGRRWVIVKGKGGKGFVLTWNGKEI